MIAQENVRSLRTPSAKAQNLPRLVSSHPSTEPTTLTKKMHFRFGIFVSDTPTVISRPRVEVVSGVLPKSDRAQES